MQKTARVSFRHRALPSEVVSERHESVVTKLGEILRSWLGGFHADRVYLQADSPSSGAADLSPGLPAGCLGAISYCPREYIDGDRSEFDDVLTLRLGIPPVDYATFLRNAMIECVEAFGAYRAAVILDEDLDLDDYDRVIELCETSGRDVDGRDGIYRIGVALYADAELCERAFRMTPAQISARLAERVSSVRSNPSGVLIVVTSELLEREEIEAVDERVRSALR